MDQYLRNITDIWSECRVAAHTSAYNPESWERLYQSLEGWSETMPIEFHLNSLQIAVCEEKAPEVATWPDLLTMYVLFDDAGLQLYRLKQKALQPTGEECNQIVGKICFFTKMAFETIRTAQLMIRRWPFFRNLLPPIIALLAADAAEALCDYGPMHRIDEMIGSVNDAIQLVDEIPLYAIVGNDQFGVWKELLPQRMMELYNMRKEFILIGEAQKSAECSTEEEPECSCE
ncbi:hypothetical protein B0I35DRAFT_485421 [Stachybotrys elegans]|uniref:Uncharacterized protein n=1 Tax=Stachybotrys elegans TaxID=80388 RepID=A0A8K0WKA0_9HYPO|nr:hypothetical protein B0I35DRAFT_485421 [Stachybotrys elegans]